MGSDQCYHHSVQNICFTRGDRLCLRSEHKPIGSEHKPKRLWLYSKNFSRLHYSIFPDVRTIKGEL
ncbi:hypothetical protein [Nostoc sp.]|uniref:hypothetical protein n=1 Tax=Nostoc sp. TaxID=1180 RepID=UPI002FFB26C6